MDLVADDDPGSVEELARYAESGRAFVSVDTQERPVGYLLLDIVDAAAHVEQVSVHPNHARRGIGRGLIEQAVTWARTETPGLRAIREAERASGVDAWPRACMRLDVGPAV